MIGEYRDFTAEEFEERYGEPLEPGESYWEAVAEADHGTPMFMEPAPQQHPARP